MGVFHMHVSTEEFVILYWRGIKIPKSYSISMKKLEQMSSKKQAAREILTYIRFHKNIPPVTAIEEFSARMYEYATNGNRLASHVFYIAHDTAEDILWQIRRGKKQFNLY